MANKQYMSRDVKSRRSTNVFNLSQRVETSAPYGMLVPCFVKQVIPGSKLKISLENQTTARPLVVRSFARLREHFDYFFVPFSQLWKPFENFITLQSNYNSQALKSAQRGVIPSSVPYFDAQTLSPLFKGDPSFFEDDPFDAAGFSLRTGARRLAEFLEYGSHSSDDGVLVPKVCYNFFNLLAYQKIYYDFYRNDYYEAYDTDAFNIDDLQGGSQQLDITVSKERLYKWFTPHYRLRKKDYFNRVTPDILPSSALANFVGFLADRTFVHSVSTNNFMPFSVPGGNTNETQQGFSSSVNDSSDPTNSQVRSFGSDVNFRGTASLSTSSVRSVAYHKFAAAREAYLKRIFAARNNYQSISDAIFGVSPNVQRSDRVYHLGGFSQVLSINGVDNTSVTGANNTYPTGQINFYLNQSKELEFTVKEHGVLMCIYSTSCENDYRPHRIDRMNTRVVPEDFFNPFYENLGKQPLYAYEYNYDNGQNDPSAIDQVRVLGFVPRYSDYKECVDVVHGALATEGFSSFSIFKNRERELDKPIYLLDLLELPQVVRDVFVGAVYNGSPSTDHFLLNQYHRIKMIAPMQPLTAF